jgi:disulfide bond formation protein DsbB
MQMQKATYRKFQNFMLFMSIFVLGFSFYIEFVNQLKPCPLCFMQRLCAFLFGFSCMAGMMVASLKRARLLSVIQCIVTGFGLYFGSRQLWLQSLPVDVNGQCLPGLQAMFQYFSWDMILKSLFWGSSDCSQIDWQWYGLSIPVWSSLYFLLMFATSLYVYMHVYLAMRKRKKF